MDTTKKWAYWSSDCPGCGAKKNQKKEKKRKKNILLYM